MTPEILISTSSFGRLDREPLSLLEEAGISYRLNPHGRRLRRQETLDLVARIDGLIAGTETLDAGVLDHATRLKVVSRCGTGLDNVDLEHAERRGIPVFSTPGAPVHAVAELTVAGILDTLRSIGRADRSLRRGEWKKPMGRLLRGKTVGIVGFGRIGRAVGHLIAAFGASLLAHDPHQDQAAAGALGARYTSLDELLTLSDIVTLHTGGATGAPLLDRPALSSLKTGAIVVNTARGSLIDEEALAEMLSENKIGGAYLDVFEREPYEGPLTGLENVLLTPHIGSYAAESRVAMEVAAAVNLISFFEERAS